MFTPYKDVSVRFLDSHERLMLSKEPELPLVIEAQNNKEVHFLKNFLSMHSTQILADIARYGAVLLRGFAINSEKDFEESVLSIQGIKGISDAFMAEEGRIHVDDLKYVLHTNAVYKTGGTLYLGGFHSENYYSTDVPSYICFGCFKPSTVGGETGLVNMEKVYQYLAPALKAKLEKNNFFVTQWLVSEVATRYKISEQQVEKIAQSFDMPVIGNSPQKAILMYKPNVLIHPVTQKKSLQINLFELPTLNTELRKCFDKDYAGKTWFWHRLVWKLPKIIFTLLEKIYLSVASFAYSPKNAVHILITKIKAYNSNKNLPSFDQVKVGSCFNAQETVQLAGLIREYYSSCLWKKGDILLIDNRKVMHAGMPGAGARVIRALIANPLTMKYSSAKAGCIECVERTSETVGFHMQAGKINSEANAQR